MNGQQAKVQIPIALPGILKDYAKAVLREQPEDVVLWSAMYFDDIVRHPQNRRDQLAQKDLDTAIHDCFRSLCNDNKGDLIDIAGCKALYAEFSGSARIPLDALISSWLSRGYSNIQLRELLSLGRLPGSSTDRDCFFAAICGTLGSTLRETLALFLQVTSGSVDQNQQAIPYARFKKVCTLLMQLNNEDQSDANLNKILDHCRQLSNRQGGKVTKKNITEMKLKALDE